VAARADCPSRFGLESAPFAQRTLRITEGAGGFELALLLTGIAMNAMIGLDLLPKLIDFAALRAEVDRCLEQWRGGP
jgi:hypothetical protein